MGINDSGHSNSIRLLLHCRSGDGSVPFLLYLHKYKCLPAASIARVYNTRRRRIRECKYKFFPIIL